jgi:uncharacterized membrane protein YphA (DoxX/SURF4 family)
LLLLRLGVGISIVLVFGISKLQGGWASLHTGQWPFADFNRKLGLPTPVLVAWLQTLNESLGALFLASGFLTRYAATALAFGFAVATYCSFKVHEPSWILAAYFWLIFTSLLLAGPGRFSIDSLLYSRSQGRVVPPVTS